ncbi:hypothetical protein L9F63_006810 [Diploptera punctata]|uniref:WD repeat-containing protein 63 n=1 Tax=Diploptera punctata TaxID=6984 RepID=A0AAD8E3W0_DIPPU|nr:hypothetical protein L9F63_006810 [Diploptera punctata]
MDRKKKGRRKKKPQEMEEKLEKPTTSREDNIADDLEETLLYNKEKSFSLKEEEEEEEEEKEEGRETDHSSGSEEKLSSSDKEEDISVDKEEIADREEEFETASQEDIIAPLVQMTKAEEALKVCTDILEDVIFDRERQKDLLEMTTVEFVSFISDIRFETPEFYYQVEIAKQLRVDEVRRFDTDYIKLDDEDYPDDYEEEQAEWKLLLGEFLQYEPQPIEQEEEEEEEEEEEGKKRPKEPSPEGSAQDIKKGKKKEKGKKLKKKGKEEKKKVEAGAEQEEIVKEGEEGEEAPSDVIKPEETKESELEKPKREMKELSEEEQCAAGTIPVSIAPETQSIINCVIGVHVTTENPWIQIKRDRLEYVIEAEEQILDFNSIKDEIKELKLEDIWVGYDCVSEIPNSFFICVTEQANLYTTKKLEMLGIERKKRVEQALVRSCREWESLGSEQEIEEWKIVDSRPLCQVEHEIIIQSLLVEPNFTDLNVEDVIHGYKNFLPYVSEDDEDVYVDEEEDKDEQDFSVQITRIRNETGTQACKDFTSSHAQTVLPFPQSKWSQYEDIFSVTELTETEEIDELKAFLKNKYLSLYDLMSYNSSFNLYEDDYPCLILEETDTQPMEQKIKKRFEEYTSFIDVLHCKNKFISSIAWHPSWSGIVACSYVDYIRCIHIQINKTLPDEIFRAVHGSNLVLIWSFVDSLKPKLILESSQEVHSLSFCPFNENILIGGCINGQVVVWDLTDKLRKVEEVINLTPSQQMYKEVLANLLSWMKNTRRLEYVSAAAMSSLQYSPTHCITSIEWLTPYHEISRMGRYGDLRDRELTSLQFLTSSEDGSVCVWDLQAPIPKQAGLSKSQRRKKRILPAALKAEVSQFRHLNNVLMPVFRINIIDPENDTIIPVSVLSSEMIELNYEFKDPKDLIKEHTYSERLLYNPVFQDPGNYPKQQFYAGTIEGHILRVSWEGSDTNTGEVINSELAKYPSWGQIHESPIIHISRSIFFNNVILTSSAKIFAVWRTDVNNVPLFWRRSKIGITSCDWSKSYPNIFSILHVDGSIEVWDLLIQSDKHIIVQSMSGSALTCHRYSKMDPLQNVIGIADHRGALRIFKDPVAEELVDLSYEIKEMDKLLNKEKERIESFKEWQNEWLLRNKQIIQAEQDAIQEELEREEKERQNKEKLELEEREKEEVLRKRLEKMQAQKIDVEKQAQEKWQEMQHKRYIKTILKQKQLDKHEMLIKVEPLNIMRALEKKKKDKLAEEIQQKDKISEDEKKISFAETLMKIKRNDLNAGTFMKEIEASLSSVVKDYKKTELQYLEEIKKNPYKYVFDWKELINEGRRSQNTVQECITVRSERENRYYKLKTERKLLNLNVEGQVKQIGKTVSTPSVDKSTSSIVQFGGVTESLIETPSVILESSTSLSHSKSGSVHFNNE